MLLQISQRDAGNKGRPGKTGASRRYHHMRARQIRNPRPETRRKSEARNPIGCSPRGLPTRCFTPSFGLRISGFLRNSGFGFRIFEETELVVLTGCARAGPRPAARDPGVEVPIPRARCGHLRENLLASEPPKLHTPHGDGTRRTTTRSRNRQVCTPPCTSSGFGCSRS